MLKPDPAVPLEPDESAGEASRLAAVAVVGVLLEPLTLKSLPPTASSTEVFSTLPAPL